MADLTGAVLQLTAIAAPLSRALIQGHHKVRRAWRRGCHHSGRQGHLSPRFGVKELGGTQPVTPDTLFMIGSITKPMTTMLAAALVKDGHLSWDRRLVDVWPQFAAYDAIRPKPSDTTRRETAD